MTPLESATLFAALQLLCHWLVMRHLRRLADPAYIRSNGVVILRESVLQGRSEPIGWYQDRPIWGTVSFMGMLYRFDRVVERRKAGPRELFLEPCLGVKTMVRTGARIYAFLTPGSAIFTPL